MRDQTRKRVLVVDDAGLVRRYYREILESGGYEVDEALNGVEAMERLLQQVCDLLIVDIFMPGMDGFETMRQVHQSRPDMPVIVISGQQFSLASEHAPDFLHMATRLGAVSSLQKPFKPSELLAVVNGSLSSSQVWPGLHGKVPAGIPSERQ